MGGFALGGAYLGGAAANNAWNPSDWKWKNASTWLGILGGGICGSLMPIGATVVFISKSLLIINYT